MRGKDTAVCASCNQPRTGRFCSQCGEEALDPHALTVQHFITETLVHETLHLDGKIWRTLGNLLFRPGFLTSEYGMGRRRPYINPLRLLITAIIAYALLTMGGLHFSMQVGPLNLSIAPTAVRQTKSIEETVGDIDRFGILGRVLAERSKSTGLELEGAREKFHARLEKFAEPLSFTNVILLALALYVMFHRKRELFLEHAAFSMHFVSFVLLTSLLAIPMLALFSSDSEVYLGAMFISLFLWQFSYLSVAIRRFYFASTTHRFRSGLLSAAAALVVYLLNSAFLTMAQMLAVALALWSI
jgi:hypothetical protein